MSVEEATARIGQYLDRFREFIEEAGNLELAITGLGLRVARTGGLTDEEVKSPPLGRAVAWAAEDAGNHVRLQVLVIHWAALEVLVEDIFTVLCPEVEFDNARLNRVRVPLAVFARLGEEDRYRELFGRIETESQTSVDRWDEIYGLVGVSIDIKALGSKRETIRGWPAEWAEPDNASMRRALREAQQIRNVTLHRGRVIDGRLAEVSGGAFIAGERLSLTNEQSGEYGRAVLDYAGALSVCVLQRIEAA
jgi:hypothetical protein